MRICASFADYLEEHHCNAAASGHLVVGEFDRGGRDQSKTYRNNRPHLGLPLERCASRIWGRESTLGSRTKRMPGCFEMALRRPSCFPVEDGPQNTNARARTSRPTRGRRAGATPCWTGARRAACTGRSLHAEVERGARRPGFASFSGQLHARVQSQMSARLAAVASMVGLSVIIRVRRRGLKPGIERASSAQNRRSNGGSGTSSQLIALPSADREAGSRGRACCKSEPGLQPGLEPRGGWSPATACFVSARRSREVPPRFLLRGTSAASCARRAPGWPR